MPSTMAASSATEPPQPCSAGAGPGGWDDCDDAESRAFFESLGDDSLETELEKQIDLEAATAADGDSRVAAKRPRKDDACVCGICLKTSKELSTAS